MSDVRHQIAEDPAPQPKVTTRIRHFSDLMVGQKAYQLALDVIALTKQWPGEERFALTDQVRRSSRSISTNIAEAWGKRRDGAHFVSKLSDADTELHETENWLLFAEAHGYITRKVLRSLVDRLQEIGRMLGSMMANPTSFLLKPPSSGFLRADLWPLTSGFFS